ncbi:MAG: aminotransferase class V-fold PLP-dependent enzyme [Mucinivorans sp.]
MNLYFDNASTSFPKPIALARAMSDWLMGDGGTYGRAATPRVLHSVAQVERCRDLLTTMIGAPIEKAENLIFTHNATHAANLVLRGLHFSAADRILVSPMEHNAIMRPVEYLRVTDGVQYGTLPAMANGIIDTKALDGIDTKGVKLVIVNHISNVNGVCQPLTEIGAWAAANDIEFMVDASQSIGVAEINVESQKIDYLIFTGHKALFGPMGTGGAWIGKPNKVEPLIYGGTGSNSASYSMPDYLPDRMQGGTPNVVGIVGLMASIDNRPEPLHTARDLEQTIARIASRDGITVYGAAGNSLFSLTHSLLSPSTIAEKLYNHYKIEVRAGLHCAPAAHRHLGTFPSGTVRIATSPYHTATDLEYLAQAIEKICI